MACAGRGCVRRSLACASGAVSLPRLRKTAVPGTRGSGGVLACSWSMNARSGPSSWTRSWVTSSRPRCQVVRMVNVMMPISRGSQAPCSSLVRLEAKKSRSMAIRTPPSGQHEPERPAPLMTGVVEEQQGRAGDRAGHGRAVGVGQRGRAPEREHEREHRHQQQPVDERDVDLAHHLFGGVFDAQPGQVAQSGGLLRDRVGAGDDGLGGDDRGHGGEEDHREPGPARSQQEERAAGVALVAQDEGALAHVVQDAGGEDEQQPGPPDR